MGSIKRFLETENAGAKLLGIATLLAVLWVNSPMGTTYDTLWHLRLPHMLSLGGRIDDLEHVVNDALMAIFFFVVGLEIKRELVTGELSSRRDAALPVAAALGGMVLPAAFYLALNPGGPSGHGWGIPIATDIAFAVALISMFGSRLPSGLKVFLLSLAIVDDIGAIAVIAVFYAGALDLGWLLASAMIGVGLWLSASRGRSRGWIFLPGGLALWVAVLFAGIHATIAGVVLAFIIPVGRLDDPRSLEDRLHPWASLAIVPLFALANAGVVLDSDALGAAITSSTGQGVILGLVMGKIAGISLFSWIAVKTRLARLPSGVSWVQLLGAAAAAGIGFTVSIFITDLAFEDPTLIETSKLAVFIASLIAAALAVTILSVGKTAAGISEVPASEVK